MGLKEFGLGAGILNVNYKLLMLYVC